MQSRPVLLRDDIVPFFINVDCDQQRLFELVQVRLKDVCPEEIASSVVVDIGIVQGFREQIQSLIEAQLCDFERLTDKFSVTDWASRGSAVHIFTIEVGIDSVVYSDVIEWDIFDLTADPDEFAAITVKELGLPCDFANVISGQIRYQTMRFRSMHCDREKFASFIEASPGFAPQGVRGLRSHAELLDCSPVVGLVPGVTAKKSISVRERNARHMKRLGAPLASGALQPADDVGVTQVKLVPVVRAAPMPEDSPGVDLAAVPQMLGDPRLENGDVLAKVQKKFESPVMMAQRQNDSGSDSGDA